MTPPIGFHGPLGRHCDASGLLVLLTLAILLTGCTTHVDVADGFPTPVTRQFPISATLVLEPGFRDYLLEVSEPHPVSLALGASQADLFHTIANAMFQKLRISDRRPTPAATDLILVPRVAEVQIATPAETQLQIFEVWVSYRVQLLDRSGELIADWSLAAYGKTPSRLLESASDALEQASIMALRDAGAAMVTSFAQAPGVAAWLSRQGAWPAADPSMR